MEPNVASLGLTIRAIRRDVREADFVASTDAIDSYGERVAQNWRLERFKSNPVALFAHNSWALPIGRAPMCKVEDNKLVCTIRFGTAKANPLAENVWNCVQEDILCAVSVGFRPHSIRMEIEDDEEVWILDDNELHEISIVPIPANPEALARMKHRALAEGKGSLSADVRNRITKRIETRMHDQMQVLAKQEEHIAAILKGLGGHDMPDSRRIVSALDLRSYFGIVQSGTTTAGCCDAEHPHILKAGDPLPDSTDGHPHTIVQLAADPTHPREKRGSETHMDPKEMQAQLEARAIEIKAANDARTAAEAKAAEVEAKLVASEKRATDAEALLRDVEKQIAPLRELATEVDVALKAANAPTDVKVKEPKAGEPNVLTLTVAQRITAVAEQRDKAIDQNIEHEVEALVGVKITKAEKEEFVELRRSNPSLFKKMIDKRAPLNLFGKAIGAADPSPRTKNGTDNGDGLANILEDEATKEAGSTPGDLADMLDEGGGL